MKRWIRPRTWVRLVAASLIAWVTAGMLLDRLADHRPILPMTRTWYINLWLVDQRREVMRFTSSVSEKFVIEPDLRLAITGPYRTTDEPIPAWVRERIERGTGYYHAGSVGWPARFAGYEAYEINGVDRRFGIPRIGFIPVATRPLFPGFLILLAAMYGLLLAGERTLRIPGKITARRRRQRGCCPRCGYDLSGIGAAVCPECGANHA